MAKNDPFLTVDNFRGGLNTQDHPMKARPNELVDVMNINPFSGSLEKRLGRTDYNAVDLPANGISLEEFDTDDGTERLLAQTNETALHTAGNTQTRSLLQESTGDGVFAEIPWYNAGTATATNGSTTVTGATTFFTANLRTASEYWIRFPNDATDTNWYTIASVSGATGIVLNRNFAGTGGGGLTYEIAKPLSANVEINTLRGAEGKAQGYKNNFWFTQAGIAPRRYDGTHMHDWGKLAPVGTVVSVNAGAGNVAVGLRRLRAIYNYGASAASPYGLGSSAPNPVVQTNLTPDLREWTLSVGRGPQACTTVDFYAQLVTAAVTDSYFFVGSVSNTASLIEVSFNLTEAQLGAVTTTLEFDNGNVDEGNAFPPNITFCHLLGNRMFAIDPDNRDLLVISKPGEPGSMPIGNAIQVQPEDGEIPNGLTESYGKLVILKDKSQAYFLTENSPLGGVESIPTSHGCVSAKSICRWGSWIIYETRNAVVGGSFRGMRVLSRRIRKSLTQVKQAVIRYLRFTATTSGEFSSGAALTNITVNADGFLELTSLTIVETTDADFNAGTFSSVIRTSALGPTGARYVLEGVSNGIAPAQRTDQSGSMLRDMCRSTVDGTVSIATTGGVGPGFNPVFVNDGNDVTGFQSSTMIADSGGSPSDDSTTVTVQLSRSYNINRIRIRWAVRGTAGNFTANVRVRFQRRDLGGVWADIDASRTRNLTEPADSTLFPFTEIFDFNGFVMQGVRVIFDNLTNTQHPGDDPELVGFVYAIECFEAGFLSGGVFTSQVLDGAVAAIGYGNVDVTFSNLHYEADTVAPLATSGRGVAAVLTMEVRTGDNGTVDGTWGAFTPQPFGSVFAGVNAALVFGRFVQYRFTFTSTGGSSQDDRGSAGVRVDDVTFNHFREGTFEGAIIDMVSAPTRYGQFLSNEALNGGAIQGAFRSGPVGTPDGTWNAYIEYDSGEYMTNGLNRFGRVRFVMTPATVPTASGTSPRVFSYTVEWFQGTSPASAYPSVARVFEDVYHLAVESEQGTFNDLVYVSDLSLLNDPHAMQQAGGLPWTRYDWTLNGMAVSGNRFYGLDANAAKAYYLLDGYNDSGTAITAYAKTAVYLNSAELKRFRRFYLMADAMRAGGSGADVSLFVSSSVVILNTNLEDLNKNETFRSDRITPTAQLVGEWKSPKLAGWTGAIEIPANLSQVQGDYKISGRGNFFQVMFWHNRQNVEPVIIHGFTITYRQRRKLPAAI